MTYRGAKIPVEGEEEGQVPGGRRAVSFQPGQTNSSASADIVVWPQIKGFRIINEESKLSRSQNDETDGYIF